MRAPRAAHAPALCIHGNERVGGVEPRRPPAEAATAPGLDGSRERQEALGADAVLLGVDGVERGAGPRAVAVHPRLDHLRERRGALVAHAVPADGETPQRAVRHPVPLAEGSRDGLLGPHPLARAARAVVAADAGAHQLVHDRGHREPVGDRDAEAGPARGRLGRTRGARPRHGSTAVGPGARVDEPSAAPRAGRPAPVRGRARGRRGAAVRGPTGIHAEPGRVRVDRRHRRGPTGFESRNRSRAPPRGQSRGHGADTLGPRVVELQVQHREPAAAGDPSRASVGTPGAAAARVGTLDVPLGSPVGEERVRVERAGGGRSRVWRLRAKVNLHRDGLEHRRDRLHAVRADLVIPQVQDAQRGVERPLRLDLDVGEEIVVALRGERPGQSLGAARADRGTPEVQLSQPRVEQPAPARAAGAQLRERGPAGQERLRDVNRARVAEARAREVQHSEVRREDPHAGARVLPGRDDRRDRAPALLVELDVGEVQRGEAVREGPTAVGVRPRGQRGANR